MTAIPLEQTYELPDAPIRGRVTLRHYTTALIERNR